MWSLYDSRTLNQDFQKTLPFVMQWDIVLTTKNVDNFLKINLPKSSISPKRSLHKTARNNRAIRSCNPNF